MSVEEHREIALHRAPVECWGEVDAGTVMDAIAVPSEHGADCGQISPPGIVVDRGTDR